MINVEEDLEMYFSDWGEEVLFQGRKVRAVPDTRDEAFKGSRVNETVLRVVTSEVKDIDKNSVITYRGTQYKVSDKNQIHDGLLSVINAAKFRT